MYTVCTVQLSCLSLNNLLDPHESGFTETALLVVTDALRAARASSLPLVLILFDLSVVFDTVNHQILLASLKLGIGKCPILVHILPVESHLSGNMEWLPVQTLHA